ncbi:response regulator [Cohnella caldifontis]|uniref:response regulator n=1 Tax=Cohnella caldifontis TaxID=3027471 RepID=UPI0023EBDE89|nr:response regulator [Cohnella sp. YIM B05605]
MTTLLLVDDEPRQVKSLSAIIGRQRPEYRILEAADAESAWEIMEKEHVDAVLTDIRMPETDGLTLIERITLAKPHVKTVLISGYGQFEYAQKALEHRVVEYLVKPIGLPDIERILLKLEELFAKESSLKHSQAVYQEHLWNGLIAGTLTEKQRLELRIPAAGAGIAMAIERNGDPFLEDGAPMEAARRTWTDLLSAMGRNIVFGDAAAGRIVSFVWLDRSLAAKPFHTASQINRLFERLRTENPAGYVLGVSTVRPDLSKDLKEAYDEAVLALRHLFYTSDEAILWGSDSRPFTDAVSPGSNELAEPLTLAVKTGDRAKAMELLDAFFQSREAPYPAPERIKEELKLMLWRLTEGLRDVAQPHAEPLSYERNLRQLQECCHYQALRFRFKKIVEAFLESSGKAHEDKNGLIILKCQAYLQEHYRDDLSLESVAALFHFNPSYFSQLFKYKTGVNFSGYLLELRIRQAMRMLENSDEKISGIAEKAGFRDAAYFNKMFKRKTGFSPNAYRQIKGHR